MDPLTVATASVIALAGLSVGLYWRARARSAEAHAARLGSQLRAERHAACHDPLTGLPNRRAFYQLGVASVSERTLHPLAVVLVDLDNFKQVNDEFGHAAGDEVLIRVARRFAAYASETGVNLVARLGGDVDEHWRHLATHRLTEILAAPMQIAGHSLVVTASVGLAPLVDPMNLADAVHRADTAMYRAKTRYRAKTSFNRVPSFATALDENLAG
jgi:diguanylate cyclase (GGDEF)-like protein